jgi:hypothetical protein
MAKPLTLPPLTETEVTALRQLYETATAPKVRLRSQIVLLAHPGRSVAEIAATLLLDSGVLCSRVVREA